MIGLEYKKSDGGYASNGLSILMRLADGRFIVVDGGFNRAKDMTMLINRMKEQSAGYADKTGGIKVAAWIITHSHGDHYNPAQALRLGTIRHVFTQETWAEGARREFAAAAAKLGVPTPEVTPLPFRKPVSVNGLTITGLPANHSTGRITNGEYERTSIYLVEKGSARMLYATDTGGIPGDAAQYIGIDAHIRNGRPITALVMEATTGFDCEDDFRLFVHSTIDTVARTVRVLTKTKRLLQPPGQSVYITHRSHIGYSGNIDADDARLPAPLKCARDGLDVTLG